jgi:hypothetical protein
MIDGASFSGSGIVEVEVDPENAWFRKIDSYLIKVLTHAMVRFFSEDSSAVISNTISELGPDAFADLLSLTTITFESPSIVAMFLNCAFCDCSSLESICIPSSVQFIGEECFSQCESLVSVTFEQPSMLEIIYGMAFHSCKSLPHISIPGSIQQIGSQCFVECKSLTSITFESPSNLSILCDLGDLMLPSLEIPDSVEVINGITKSSGKVPLVVSFSSGSKLSTVYPTYHRQGEFGAFVRYSEATLRRFRANVDDFAPSS